MLRKAGSWLLLGMLVALAFMLERRGQVAITPDAGRPVHVIDGDSFRIGSSEIRLAGIDAPEYRQTCLDLSGAAWPCGKEARAALERMVRIDGLRCARQAEDRYGRALSHCTTKAGDVAAAMALEGWALDVRDERFDGHQDEIDRARAAKHGIWRGRHQHPADWRKAQEQKNLIASDPAPAEFP